MNRTDLLLGLIGGGGSMVMRDPEPPAPRRKYAIEDIYKDMSPEAIRQLNDHLSSVDPLTLPFRQVSGASQLIPRAVRFGAGQENTTSTSFTNLTTEGPTLTGLADGLYIVLLGFEGAGGAGDLAIMALSENGAAASNANAAVAGTARASVAALYMPTLKAGGNNSLQAKYRCAAGVSGGFEFRWIFAQRVANP